MALLIQDILEQNLFPGARLAAGRSGAGTPVSWVNVMEILDSPDTVQPGELLVTTGYGLDDSSRYGNLIERLKSRGVSGMAIQPYYIASIPEYLLSDADRVGFPVLELPPDLTFSEILHVLYHQISLEDSSKTKADSLYEAACSSLKDISDADWSALFSQETPCPVHVLLFEAVNYSSLAKACWEESYDKLLSFLASPSLSLISRPLPGGNAAVLTACPVCTRSSLLFYDLNSQLKLLSELSGTHYYIGTEALSAPSSCMPALRHAFSCIEQLRQIEAGQGVCAYSNRALIKALGILHQGGNPDVYDSHGLKTLEKYDRENGTDYVRALRIYLAVGCNVTQAASHLFIHRHTLLNWLNKITSLTHLDLNDYYTRTHLSLLLLLKDYYAQ